MLSTCFLTSLAVTCAQERDHMTGEVERLKAEEAQASLDKKRAAEALMQEVYRSNAEQVLTCSAQ